MGTRRPFTWTQGQLDKLNSVQKVLQELQAYKPLTLRQVYYQLVGKGLLKNNKSQYGMLSNLLKWARIDGYVEWNDIEDRVRKYVDLTGWSESGGYLSESLHWFLSDYRRDILQNQRNYIEIWIEKDALSTLFKKVAEPYTVSVVVCRGFSSVSFLNDYKIRLSHHPNQVPILLYFGDFDPSGVEMLESMEKTLRDELKVERIQFKRIALSREDIALYRLPHSPDALKKTDPRANKHLQEYGEIAVELDALRPDILEQMIRTAIENEIDPVLLAKEQRIEQTELDKLYSIKQNVTRHVNGQI